VGTPEINVLGDAFFHSAIFGNQGSQKTGAGRFTFRFNPMEQTCIGPVKISDSTMGLNKDRSLGDVNNETKITPADVVNSTLFAEPENNAAATTLPGTRMITPNDSNSFDASDPCLSASPAAVSKTSVGAG
jgi:hypothetical protein